MNVFLKEYNDNPWIIIEIKDTTKKDNKLFNIVKRCATSTGDVLLNNNGYAVKFNEINVEFLVRELSKLGYYISKPLQEFYDKILKLDHKSTIDKFRLENNEIIRTALEKELGPIETIPSLILQDRSIRYQYHWDTNPSPNNLVEFIANRDTTRIWIDRNNYSLYDIIVALQELKRFPLLLVFDFSQWGNKEDQKHVVHNALNKANIIDVSLPKNTQYTFNKMRYEYKYNKRLISTTKVSGIINGDLPKYYLKSEWKPMSVIQLGIFPQNNKTSIYSNQSDLIITYTNKCPLDLE